MDPILTDKSLLGVHLTSRRKALETQRYFSREDHLSRALDLARKSGIKRLLCTTNPLLFKLLRRDPERWPFEIFAVVPNFSQFVRDTSLYGTTGAALRRILAMPLARMFDLGMVSIKNAEKILGMRFDILMNLFLMAESSQFTGSRGGHPLNLKAVFLHHQIADLALALGQSDLLKLFIEIAHDTFDSQAGVSTNNFIALKTVIATGRMRFDWILSPFNPRGHLMNPARKDCEEILKRTGFQGTIADHWKLSNAIPLDEGLAYLHSHPFSAATVEFEDLLDPDFPRWIEELKH